jgi:hypothetical protein
MDIAQEPLHSAAQEHTYGGGVSDFVQKFIGWISGYVLNLYSVKSYYRLHLL